MGTYPDLYKYLRLLFIIYYVCVFVVVIVTIHNKYRYKLSLTVANPTGGMTEAIYNLLLCIERGGLQIKKWVLNII